TGGSIAPISATSDQNLALACIELLCGDLPVIGSCPGGDSEQNSLSTREELRPAVAGVAVFEGSQLMSRASGGGNFQEPLRISAAKHDRIIRPPCCAGKSGRTRQRQRSATTDRDFL